MTGVLATVGASLAQAPAKAEPNFMMWVGASVFVVLVAAFAMRWLGKTVKKDLDPERTGRMRASMAIQADSVPPHLVKEALQKGLVSSQQLATMSPVERQYLFNTLKPKLDGPTTPQGGTPTVPPMLSANAPVLPLKPSVPAAPVNAPQLRSTQAMVAIPGKPLDLPPLTPEQLAALGPPAGGASSPPRGNPGVAPLSEGSSGPRSPARGAAAVSPEDPFAAAEPMKVHCPCCGELLIMPAFPPHVTFCDQCGAKTAVRVEDQGRLIINTAPPGVTRRPVR